MTMDSKGRIGNSLGRPRRNHIVPLFPVAAGSDAEVAPTPAPTPAPADDASDVRIPSGSGMTIPDVQNAIAAVLSDPACSEYDDELSIVRRVRASVYTEDLALWFTLMAEAFALNIASKPVAHGAPITLGNQVTGIKLYDGRHATVKIVVEVTPSKE